jgi:hypothetical protein
MNWGYKILFLYLSFVAGMLYLVVQSSRQKIDLVSEDYYARTINFQDQIDHSENASKGNLKIQVDYDKTGRKIGFIFPKKEDQLPKGKITFFRPDNAALDFSIDIDAPAFMQEIPTEELKRGMWRIQFRWEMGGVPLYQEERIQIE